MFGKLKQHRGIATRYDKTVLSFGSFLNLAATRLWLKSFVNAAKWRHDARLCTTCEPMTAPCRHLANRTAAHTGGRFAAKCR